MLREGLMDQGASAVAQFEIQFAQGCDLSRPSSFPPPSGPGRPFSTGNNRKILPPVRGQFLSKVLVILVGFLGACQEANGQALVWERAKDSTAAKYYDYYNESPDPQSYQYHIGFPSKEKVEFVDLATGVPIVSIPRPVNPDSGIWFTYITRKWADEDEGFEILVSGTPYSTSGASGPSRFKFMDGDKVIVEGEGIAQLASDGRSAFIISQLPDAVLPKGTRYRIYKLRDGVKPVAAHALPKAGASQPRGMVFLGQGLPGFRFDENIFGPTGQIKKQKE